MRAAIKRVGATLCFLPPSSPALNPLEPGFAKRKALLRHAAERRGEATGRRIGARLARFGPEEWVPYFTPAGYAST